MQETVIIVPSFNPDEKFSTLLRCLRESGITHIVVVNDGSRPECEPFFTEAQQQGAVVLVHAVNQGKGRALKTAFHYVLNTFGDSVLAVCADADGQHAVKDILAVGKRLAECPEHLVMGCRQFDDSSIPARSRYGNRLTRFVFRTLCGVRVSDTQTGLRGLSGRNMRLFLATRGEGFEYEMNMLLDSREYGIAFMEVPISTIYLEENKTSHFHPLRDSLRIYSVFAKFLLSSLGASLVDLALFRVLTVLFMALPQTGAIFLATLLARICSSLVNFGINKNRVFQTDQHSAVVLVKYYILCLVQLICSAALVDLLVTLTGLDSIFVKVPIDLFLFFLSFQIQREWVFRKPQKN